MSHHNHVIGAIQEKNGDRGGEYVGGGGKLKSVTTSIV